MVKDYGSCSCGGRIHPMWFFGKKYLSCVKCGNEVLSAESKKLPPVEKAIDTGIASGATMEGLDLALTAEMEPKTELCLHCGERATETCDLCDEKECKECFEEHLIECNHCDGEGEVPRSWTSDSGDRWNPPTLDVDSYEPCEYCDEGQVCVNEKVPEFSWEAERNEIDICDICDDAEVLSEDDGYLCGKCGALSCHACGSGDPDEHPYCMPCIYQREKDAGEWDAESFSAEQKCGNCGMMKDVLNMMPSGDTCRGCFESWSKEKQEGYDAEPLNEYCAKPTPCSKCGLCLGCMVESYNDDGMCETCADYFSAESNGDKQLDLAVKRTKMSALRTGLAITTFGIVMWNLWTNKKQERDISDIMAEL